MKGQPDAEKSFFLVSDKWRCVASARSAENSFVKKWWKGIGCIAMDSETSVEGTYGPLSVRVLGREVENSSNSTEDHATDRTRWVGRVRWKIKMEIQGLFIDLGNYAVVCKRDCKVQEVDCGA